MESVLQINIPQVILTEQPIISFRVYYIQGEDLCFLGLII